MPTKSESVVKAFIGTKSAAITVILWPTMDTWKLFSTPVLTSAYDFQLLYDIKSYLY